MVSTITTIDAVAVALIVYLYIGFFGMGAIINAYAISNGNRR